MCVKAFGFHEDEKRRTERVLFRKGSQRGHVSGWKLARSWEKEVHSGADLGKRVSRYVRRVKPWREGASPLSRVEPRNNSSLDGLFLFV